MDQALKLGLAAGVGPAVLAACGGSVSQNQGQSSGKEFSWTQFKGQQIQFWIDKNAVGDYLLQKIPEFEALTGIKTVAQAFPEDQFRQKEVVALQSGSGGVDAFMTLIGQEGKQFLQAGWYHPLEDYTKNSSLTDPKWNFSDFTKAALSTQQVSGKLVGIPAQLDCEIMTVNTELLNAKGIQPPKTLDELEKAAAALTDKSKGVYGIVSRGQRAAAVSMFCSYLYNMGGRWLKPNGDPDIDSSQAVDAFKLYGHLLRDYGPPGVQNFGFNEVNSIFMEGKAAIVTDGASFNSFYQDPTKSKVVGKVGYHRFPTGPGGDHPIIYGWGIAIAGQSQHPEAAWLLAQWATSQQMQLALLKDGQASGRSSVWESPDVVKTMNAGLLDAYKHSYQVGNPEWVPPVIPVAQIRDIIGEVIFTAIEGGDVKSAAQKAAGQMKDAIQKAGG